MLSLLGLSFIHSFLLDWNIYLSQGIHWTWCLFSKPILRISYFKSNGGLLIYGNQVLRKKGGRFFFKNKWWIKLLLLSLEILIILEFFYAFLHLRRINHGFFLKFRNIYIICNDILIDQLALFFFDNIISLFNHFFLVEWGEIEILCLSHIIINDIYFSCKN